MNNNLNTESCVFPTWFNGLCCSWQVSEVYDLVIAGGSTAYSAFVQALLYSETLGNTALGSSLEKRCPRTPNVHEGKRIILCISKNKQDTGNWHCATVLAAFTIRKENNIAGCEETPVQE